MTPRHAMENEGKRYQVNPIPHEEVVLYRGGNPSSSLLNAFGASLRETRITAALGYLISQAPIQFKRLLQMPSHITEVAVEKYQEGDRLDIYIKTDKTDYVIEAKVSSIDPFRQASRYRAKNKILLTNFIPSAGDAGKKHVSYVKWENVSALLRELRKSPIAAVKFVSNDLLKYMEEHGMINSSISNEVYIRELSEESIVCSLKAGVYGCDYEKNSRITSSLYFAPHFTAQASRHQPAIQQGISYVARIIDVFVAGGWADFAKNLKDRNGKVWWRNHKAFLETIHNWNWDNHKQRHFLILDKPILVFNPPIRKEFLQSHPKKGPGMLGKYYFTFEQLFRAWNSEKIYKEK